MKIINGLSLRGNLQSGMTKQSSLINKIYEIASSRFAGLAMTFFIVCITLVSCGSSSIYTTPSPETSTSSEDYQSFSLASDFPADVVIPGIEGMRDTAFVVSVSSPVGVVAIDIGNASMKLSQIFRGMTCPDGSGIPTKVAFVSKTDAFLLTSYKLIRFNPVNGEIKSSTSVTDIVSIGNGLKNSDGTNAESSVKPAYPGGIAFNDDLIFVSMANYLRTDSPAIAAPGTVLVFEFDANNVKRIDHFVTTGYNPTGLAVRDGSELIVTNSGVLSIVDAKGVPETESSIDIVDVDSLSILANVPLGNVAAAFHTPALTYDASRVFVGSAAYGEIYEIDLINRQLLHGETDPIVVSDGSDLITDVKLSVDNAYLFATSFEKSSVYPFDLSQSLFTRGDPFVVGFPSGVSEENPSGANTGAGPMAVRPGSKGVDYSGADLYVLTGYPGSLVAVETDAPAKEYLPEVTESESSPPPPAPTGSVGTPCQGFAQAVYSVTYGEGAGFGQSMFPNIVLGPPNGKGSLTGGLDVLSLGKFGEIILDVGNCTIVDGPGDDFTVFENAFYISGNSKAPFAELGTVAVSGDGVNFFEFECSDSAFPYTGCSGWTPVYSTPTNGISPFKPMFSGGEAFDLASVGLGSARFVRIRDLKGTGGGGGTAGFDLDAIAVINGRIN